MSEPRGELFIGLVGAAGTDLGEVFAVIESEISRFGYSGKQIRLSEKIHEVLHGPGPKENFEDKRILTMIKGGNRIRRESESQPAVAALGIAEIRATREEYSGDRDNVNIDLCYTIRSLKKPDEVAMFRKLYKERFILISVFETRFERIANLARRISHSHAATASEKFRSKAEEIISVDYKEQDEPFGQNVRDTFSEADFFLRYGDREYMKNEIRRFLEIIFGFPFHTPRTDEMGMYYAQSASYRSADLSRQVGAALANENGELLATGCNEVPARGGGLPWPGNDFDPRDFNRGYDTNTRIRLESINELLGSLQRAGWLNEDLAKLTPSELTQRIEKDNQLRFKETRIGNLIEFGRVVHAEMNALLDAGRRGIATAGSVLFCTTYPCHMCARHIIAAGIQKVVYIEPYQKSLATEIYDDMISDSQESSQKVYFQSFRGVAPRFFMNAFRKKGARKDASGDAVRWDARSASLPHVDAGWTYAEEENILLSDLRGRIARIAKL